VEFSLIPAQKQFNSTKSRRFLLFKSSGSEIINRIIGFWFS